MLALVRRPLALVPAEGDGTTGPPEALKAAVDLSGRMLDAARAGDWDRLAVLEHDRSRLLAVDLAAVIAQASGADADRMRADLAACIRLNDEITALTGSHISRLGELIAEMSASTSANGPPPRQPG